MDHQFLCCMNINVLLFDSMKVVRLNFNTVVQRQCTLSVCLLNKILLVCFLSAVLTLCEINFSAKIKSETKLQVLLHRVLFFFSVLEKDLHGLSAHIERTCMASVPTQKAEVEC